MTEPNDPKLKLAMARLLPEKIAIIQTGGDEPIFIWLDSSGSYLDDGNGNNAFLRETEWPYVMQLVEQTLNPSDTLRDNPTWDAYIDALREVVEPTRTHGFVATFNQRATAMCRVKGIEV